MILNARTNVEVQTYLPEKSAKGITNNVWLGVQFSLEEMEYLYGTNCPYFLTFISTDSLLTNPWTSALSVLIEDKTDGALTTSSIALWIQSVSNENYNVKFW